MPSKVLNTYRRFQEKLQTRNAVAGGLGTPYTRYMGIPQGCPMSMMIIMLVLRAWIIEMRATKVKPRDLADDLLMVASGPGHGEHIAEAVEMAYQYLQDMGAKVASSKSILFSSCPATRKKFRAKTWKCGCRIPVVRHAMDLGAQLATSNRGYAKTLRTRLKVSTKMVRKIGRLPIIFKNKAYSIRSKALAKALYGCEAAMLHPADQMALTTAIKQAISKTATHKAADLTFVTSSHGTDIDPETVVLTRRVTMLRRMLTKRPRLRKQIERILNEYKEAEYTGTQMQPILDGTAEIAYLATRRDSSGSPYSDLSVRSVYC